MQHAIRIGYKLALALSALLNLTSCHWRADVGVVKNSTPDSLLIAYQPNEEMTDSILYEERFDEVQMGRESFTISIPFGIPSRAPDSEKVFVYAFSLDSVRNHQLHKQVTGTVKHSLIKKAVLQLNKVKEPLDTIYIGK